jgi:hypothetical protein
LSSLHGVIHYSSKHDVNRRFCVPARHLISISLSTGNTAFAVENILILSYDRRELIWYFRSDSSATIPCCVERLGSLSFSFQHQSLPLISLKSNSQLKYRVVRKFVERPPAPQVHEMQHAKQHEIIPAASDRISSKFRIQSMF